MPWKEVGKVELRRMFISVLESGKCSFSEACRQFGISRKTGYKWFARYRLEGTEGLNDWSRRPHQIRYATDPEVVELLILERKSRPRWGARKLCKRLEMKGVPPPPERTANRILKRAGLVEPKVNTPEEPKRFERPNPNDLWQLDHKKAIHGSWARRTVPLVVVDDCSRYLLGLRAQPDKGLSSTWNTMWNIFGEFGLPHAILSDNDRIFHGIVGPSQFEARLMRLGIRILHGRVYHPQTQGKVERFNGTLERELLKDGSFSSCEELQSGFDRFRYDYNFERPHESLGMDVPGSRYQPSKVVRPAALPEMEYPVGAVLRKVQKDGWISWKGYRIGVGAGLHIEVFYGCHRILGESLDDSKKRRSRRV
jgi:transposase InsO family protein